MFTSKESSDAIAKLSAARTQLVIRFKFFGYLALTFRFVESESAGGMGTMCVDPDSNLYYNPKFVNNLTDVQAVACLTHEVLHVVQACSTRFPSSGNRMLWNLAADWVVNSMILATDESVGPVKKLGEAIVNLAGFPPGVYQYAKDKTTEQIYFDLLKQDSKLPKLPGVCKHGPKDKGQNDPGPNPQQNDKRNGLGCPSGSSFGEKLSKSSGQTREWTEKILSAARAADMGTNKGDTPGWLTDFYTKLTQPTVTWKDFVRRSAMSSFKGRYTWHRPARRSEAIGMRLQTKKRTPKGAIITIDSSGSISDKMLHQFLSETAAIMHACGAKEVWVYFHDVECYYKAPFTKEALSKIKVQRGGTSHIPVFKAIKEDKRDVGLIVCFTDLCSDFPAVAERPKCSVLWAVPVAYKDVNHPWGDKVVVDI